MIEKSYAIKMGDELEILQDKLRTDELGNFIGTRRGQRFSRKIIHMDKLWRYYLRAEYGITKTRKNKFPSFPTIYDY